MQYRHYVTKPNVWHLEHKTKDGDIESRLCRHKIVTVGLVVHNV